jgi:pimeloyl-ACP methyl ester carboxylesterase
VPEPDASGWTRRRVLVSGLGTAVAALAGGYELVDHGVLPGKHTLDELDGACSVPSRDESFVRPGPTITGRFVSRARNRTVGYVIAYPPGHRRGSRLPLGLYLHDDGGNHTSGLGGLPLAHALAGKGLPAIAMVAVDGGNLYWHPHPGDDPMGMLIDEVIPMCRRLGLGVPHGSIGTIGISMGGYGALLLAEKHPDLIAATAAISPAIWTSYPQAHAANPGAYTNAQEFAENDAVTHTRALLNTPTRIAAGSDDPFYPGVLTLARRLSKSALTVLTAGCHDGAFFASQRHASIAYLAQHLVT